MSATRKAFTIVELLVVMAIIAMLVTLVITSLRGLRQAANRTESLNALRGLVMAYNSYSTDARGNLMPGFLDDYTRGLLGIEAKLRDGTKLTVCGSEVCDASSYVWRMVPYMDHNWYPVMADYRSTQIIAYFEQETNADGIYGLGSANWPTELGVGAVPSFGLNSIFLGGDAWHGGDEAVDRNPWSGIGSELLAATKFTQVRNPAKIITFGSTRYYDDQAEFFPETGDRAPVGDVTMGYCELRPPYVPSLGGSEWDFDQHWYLSGTDIVANNPDDFYDNGGGLPVGRWGEDNFLSGLLDGSTAVEDLNVMGWPDAPIDEAGLRAIMSRWSPFVTAPISE